MRRCLSKRGKRALNRISCICFIITLHVENGGTAPSTWLHLIFEDFKKRKATARAPNLDFRMGAQIGKFRKLPTMNALCNYILYIIYYIAYVLKIAKEKAIQTRINVVLMSRQFLGFCDLDNQKVFFLTSSHGDSAPT